VRVTDRAGEALCDPEPVTDAAGQWSCVVPSGRIPDTGSTFWVIAAVPEAAGLWVEASFAIARDGITVTLASPIDGEAVDPTADLPVNGWIDAPLAGTPVRVTDAAGNRLCDPDPIADAQGLWSCVIPAKLLPDTGGLRIRATAVDPSGQEAVDSVDVTVTPAGGTGLSALSDVLRHIFDLIRDLIETLLRALTL